MAEGQYNGSSDPKNEYAHENRDLGAVHGPRPNPRLKPAAQTGVTKANAFRASYTARTS